MCFGRRDFDSKRTPPLSSSRREGKELPDSHSRSRGGGKIGGRAKARARDSIGNREAGHATQLQPMQVLANLR